MTPNEIRNKQFDKAMSGYRTEEVSNYLSEVSKYVNGLHEEKHELEQKLMVLAEKLEEYREDEESLRAVLIGAQKLGDNVVRESKRKAEQILTEAQQKADATILSIKSNIDRETDILNKMQAEVARFKGQILSMYKQHIESIQSIPCDDKESAHALRHALKQSETPAGFENTEAVTVEESKTAKTRDTAAPHKDFVVTIEEELEYEETVEVSEEPARRESRHGDLQFGERYTLTRNE